MASLYEKTVAKNERAIEFQKATKEGIKTKNFDYSQGGIIKKLQAETNPATAKNVYVNLNKGVVTDYNPTSNINQYLKERNITPENVTDSSWMHPKKQTQMREESRAKTLALAGIDPLKHPSRIDPSTAAMYSNLLANARAGERGAGRTDSGSRGVGAAQYVAPSYEQMFSIQQNNLELEQRIQENTTRLISDVVNGRVIRPNLTVETTVPVETPVQTPSTVSKTPLILLGIAAIVAGVIVWRFVK
jgi:hypothetical protein